jgi:hypothetical protein
MKLIKNLTEQELIELIKTSIQENRIELSGIAVASSTGSLEECEEVINRLITKHKEYLLLIRESKFKLGGGF